MESKILTYRGPARNSDGQETVNHYEHRHAVERRYKGPFGRSMRAMLEGWERYAMEYKDRFGDCIGTDGFVAEPWRQIGMSLRELLNMDIGGFDGGSLSQNIAEVMKDNGCTLEE
jgi:hypothetical protein